MDINIKGFKELDEELARLPLKLQKQMLGKVVRAGAAVVQKEAKTLAPKRIKEWEGMKYKNPSGTLKRGIIVRRKKKEKGDLLTYEVTLKSGKKYGASDAWYGRLVEMGHWFSGKVRGRRLKWVAPKPFMRPAFANSTQKVINAMRDKFSALLRGYQRG